jgi:hypothetical protein
VWWCEKNNGCCARLSARRKSFWKVLEGLKCVGVEFGEMKNNEWMLSFLERNLGELSLISHQ